MDLVTLTSNTRTRPAAFRLAALTLLLLPLVAACGDSGGIGPTVKRSAFTEKEYGVKSSPRVSKDKHPKRGGGRYLVGKPYTVRGNVYVPQEDPQGYAERGTASWYGSDFHGRLTANGEIFSANAITGAHPTLPLPSYVRVINTDNGRSVVVRVNDRGPYIHGRIMDLSHRAADILGYVNRGMGNIEVRYIGPAPLNGDDTKMLVASVNRLTRMEAGQTRFAFADTGGDKSILDGGTVNVTGGRISFADASSATGGQGGNDLALFGYVADEPINAAHAAANAMATRSTDLGAWVNVVDEDARAIKLTLGTFADADHALEVAQSFALLGAVNEESVAVGSRTETRLVLTRLKPGVARMDVLNLARELGLTSLSVN